MPKNIRLEQLAPRRTDTPRVRQFFYPPTGPDKDKCVVHLRYMSPSLFEDANEKSKPKTVVNGRERAQEETDVKTLRETITGEILMKAVVKIDGLTPRKLAQMIEMSPDAVKEALGGDLDAEIAADPSDPGASEAATSNIRYLLNHCSEFFQWTMDVCSNLGHFQDKAWAEQTKNSESGGGSNSAAI